MNVFKDPICGMTVPQDSVYQTEQDGQSFYFCSEECRNEFLGSPVVDQPAGPCAIVIFGASGDLTKRKLLPSLYNLVANGSLARDFLIIGVGRRDWDDGDFREHLRSALSEFSSIEIEDALWKEIEDRLVYCSGSYSDPEMYRKLGGLLSEAERTHHTGGNALFYLSVPPASFGPISLMLSEGSLLKETPRTWRRVVIEKPFGHDLESARELNATLLSAMTESQIYRIDHYLGKETAQNLLVFRIGNSIMEPVWNRNYIDSVEITAAESIGIESRAAFYESAGAFRDMMQSHLLMLLTLVAMEPPSSLAGEAVRNEKAKLLDAVRILSPGEALIDTVRGQYGSGVVNGTPVAAYRDEQGVSPNSTVETFAAMKLWVDNWRWAGVPFYLRTGKRLTKRVAEIVVRFKSPPLPLYAGTECSPLGPNLLVMRIQPEEGITLQMRAKVPGTMTHTRAVTLDFDYSQFGEIVPTSGYEKLLYDSIVGDPTLFHRTDLVESAWRVADPILEAWNSDPFGTLAFYDPGTMGPIEAEQLLDRDGRKWWTV